MSVRMALPRRGIHLFGLVLKALPIAVAGFAAWLAWTQIAVYGGSLVKNYRWVRTVQIPTLSALDQTVFKELVDHGLIWSERLPGLVFLRHTPCFSTTMGAPERAGVTADHTQMRQLIELLCRSQQGEFIQNEIEAWNSSYDLLAVRDNRNTHQQPFRVAARPPASGERPVTTDAKNTDGHCDGVKVTARFYVPAGCYENAWSPYYVRNAKREAATAGSESEEGSPAPTSPNAEPPGREYAFLASENLTYPGDWRVLTPYAGDRAGGEGTAPVGYYRLESPLTVGSEPISIQVVGHVFDVGIGSRWTRPLPDPGQVLARLAPQTLQVGGVKIEIELLCGSALDSNDANLCLKEGEKDEASAYQITLTAIGKRSAIVDVGIRALPSFVPAAEFAEAPNARRVTLKRTTHIELHCDGPHPQSAPPESGSRAATAGLCQLTWSNPTGTEQRGGDTKVQVFPRSGNISITEPSGLLTNAAYEEGFAEVVGLGPTTYGSLAQSLARKASDPVRLTIDSDLQRRVNDVLTENIKCNPKARRANPALCEEGSRGTLVVMDADAGITGGEILATASWPRMDPGLGAWDINALDAGLPGESPIAGNAWRAHDVSAMAGSTFKIVTSLAAAQEALKTDDKSLLNILMGTAPLKELQERLSIYRAPPWTDQKCDPKPAGSSAGTAVVVWNRTKTSVLRCIGNSREQGRAPDLFEGELAIYQRACGNSLPNRIGACEALVMSSNLYFAGMGLALDLPRIERQIPEPQGVMHDLALVQMARRLFPDGLQGESSPDANAHNFQLARGLAVSPSRLGATPFILPGEISREQRPDRREIDFANSGFGQTVTATPVDLVTAYASFGSRTIIRPTLVHLTTPRTERGDPLEGGPLLDVDDGRKPEYEKLIASLSRGLNSVITVGTASSAKSGYSWGGLPQQLRDAIFVKTGTASLSTKRALYSSWVAGYVDKPTGIKSGITRRIAFACNVSRTLSFGARACGQIVGTLIADLHANGLP